MLNWNTNLYFRPFLTGDTVLSIGLKSQFSVYNNNIGKATHVHQVKFGTTLAGVNNVAIHIGHKGE